MPWEEFKQFLSGVGPDTPLGRIVAIRSESNENVLKNFTPSQRKIRAEWMEKTAKAKTKEETMAFVEQMKQALITMAGGGKN